MWALRTSQEQWTDDDKEGLVRLFEPSPCLQMAEEFCHERTAIFATPLRKRAGKRQIWPWMQQGRASKLRCFDSVLTPGDNWLDDRAPSFSDRHTSGFVAGCNNQRKVIKRRGDGMLNVTHWFQRLQLDL